MSKGSKPRPFSVSFDEYDDNFNKIFRKNKIDEVLVDSASEFSEEQKQVDLGNMQVLIETPQ